MRTNLWRYEFSDRKGNRIMSFETWTDVGCLPVDFVHFSKAANVNMVKRLTILIFLLKLNIFN